MKKVSTMLGTALVCLAVSSAWAGGWEDPNDMSSYSYSYDNNQIGMSNSPSGMSSGFTMPVNPNMLASTYAGNGMMPSSSMGMGSMSGGMGMMPSMGMGGMSGGMGMMPSMGMGSMSGGMGMMPSSSMGMGGMSSGMGMMPSMGMGSSYPSSGSSSSLMPTVDLRRVVWQGVRGLPQQQQQYGAMSMANQNLNQLNQGMSNSMSPIYQMRNNIRNQIMGNRMSDISRMGQRMFMPVVQPGAIQSMISQIQPWNFPSRFQSAMMPNMAPYVSQSIIPRQMQYMQQGIMNNPDFPFPRNSMMGGYNSGDMSSSGMGMMPGMGMGMPNMSMMGGGMGMMPSMGGMMGGGMGMMPSMGMGM